MKVTLINHTRNPEDAIINATRLCYDSYVKQSQDSDKKLLLHLCKNNEGPLEFAQFTFVIKNISRCCANQLVRHRIAGYAQRSQRYCKEDGFGYVIPPNIVENNLALLIFNKTMKVVEKAYENLLALNLKPEEARYLLPNACFTQIYVTMNARSFRNFLKLRLSKKAQDEIRFMASRMRDEVNLVAPNLVSDFY